MSSSTGSRCASCKKPASQRCSGCTEGVDADGNACLTFYCGKECQTTDWSNHKNLCRHANARKVLFRGGELIKTAFLLIREHAFDYEITEVKKTANGKIQVKEALDLPGEGPLYRFPNNLVSSSEDRNAILSFAACTDPLIYLHSVYKAVLDGITSESNLPIEIVLILKTSSKVVRNRPINITDHEYGHQLLQVSLKNQERYVIDPSGSQHGQDAAVLPLQKYYKDYVRMSGPSEDFGWEVTRTNKIKRRKLDHEVGSGFDHRMPHVLETISTTVVKAIESSEAVFEKTLTMMLRDKQVDFDRFKKDFLSNLEVGMKAFVEWTEAEPRFQESVANGNQHAQTGNVGNSEAQIRSRFATALAHGSTVYDLTGTAPRVYRAEDEEEEGGGEELPGPASGSEP